MTTQTPASVPSSATEKTFLGQPRQLSTLFSVEMWERFSFYGMQGILLIYLYYSVADGGLDMDRVAATSIVGAYGGLVYLSTILGAWLADRLIGPERTLFYAAIVRDGRAHRRCPCCPVCSGVGVGLVLIALGSGGVKANATSLVGTLYAGTTSAGTRASRSTTWASTWAPSSDRCSPGWCSRTGASTPASRWPPSGWPSA